MKNWCITCVLAAGVCAGWGWAAGPAGDVPELKPLDHYAGRWDSTMTVKPNAGLPAGATAKGLSTGEWVDGGRFLRQTWTSDGKGGLPAMTGTTIMTYDPRQRAYRSWSFISTGSILESRGTWDAKTQTMTWIGRDAESGQTSTIRATFAADGTETWTIVDTDQDGKVVSDVSGRNTRRKD